MALVKYGSAVTQISGSVGGVTYARNKGGAYLRSRTSPTQPNSALQVGARTLFSAAVNAWTNTLTSYERTSWNAYAAAVPYTNIFGETRYYSGQQRYVQCYIARVNAGGLVTAASTAPTTYTEAATVSFVTLSMTEGAATPDSTAKLINSTGPADIEAGDILLYHFGSPVTNATEYFNGPWRYAGKSVHATGTIYPTVTVTDPFGRTITEDMRVPIYYRVLKVDNRISSESRGILTVGVFAV
jgi:hypothetical protein